MGRYYPIVLFFIFNFIIVLVEFETRFLFSYSRGRYIIIYNNRYLYKLRIPVNPVYGSA